MSQTLQSIRGMHDLFSDQLQNWLHLENILQQLATHYGYQPVRTPILEKTELFKRSLGQDTDVVEKEMYTFEDRNGDLLSLRPEGTASCVRAGIEHGQLHNQVQAWWYLGPMFRRERPQKGRLRQFHQFGIELFGSTELSAEIELIAFADQLWEQLELKDITLHINTLGNQTDRQRYRTALVKFLTPLRDQLTPDEQTRLERNPLRLLDSKSPSVQALLKKAPAIQDYLSPESVERYDTLKQHLSDLNITYQDNPSLVRGLDYYNEAVFEWTTDALGAQGTLCAGGRYDTLVEQLGGSSTPAVGFALGLERTLELMKIHTPQPQQLVILSEPNESTLIAPLAAQLRHMNLQCVIRTDFKGGPLKNQLKRAHNTQAAWALILESAEQYQIKPLQTHAATITCSPHTLKTHLDRLIKGSSDV